MQLFIENRLLLKMVEYLADFEVKDDEKLILTINEALA